MMKPSCFLVLSAVLSFGCAAPSASPEELEEESDDSGKDDSFWHRAGSETPRQIIDRLSVDPLVVAAQCEIDGLFNQLVAEGQIDADERGFTEAQQNHSHRCFLFARAFALKNDIAFDEVGLFLVAMFHDLGLHPRGTAHFEAKGAQALRSFLEKQGASRDRIEHLPDAISWHTGVLPVGSLLFHPSAWNEARLFQRGAYADVFGVERQLGVPRTAAEAIRRAFPMISSREAVLEDIFRSKVANLADLLL
jgi:hypothetical protein